MNKISLLTYLMLFTLSLWANDLYFISGHPRSDIMNQFPVQLIRYDENGAVETIELVPNSLAAKAVLPYQKQGFVIITAQDMLHAKDYLYFLNIMTPQKLHTLDVTQKGYSFIRPFLIEKNNKLICVQDYFGWNQDPKRIYQGINITDSKTINVNESDLVNLIATGSPGGAVGGCDQFQVDINDSHELRLGLKSRPLMNITLPKNHPFSTEEIISMNINNEKFMMISSRNRQEVDQKNQTKTEIWIYKKGVKEWDRLKIEGIPTFYRGFGNWMAGTITERTQGRNSGKVKVDKKELPGKEKRNPNLTKTGTPADYRYATFEIYTPGRLLLYNVETKDKIVIETGQGDSEVLLINNNEVYYRVYNEIYKAEINQNKIENKTLLMNGELVPDIHWAFVSTPNE